MSADRELRVLLRDALEHQANLASNSVAPAVTLEVDPWCKAGVVCLHAQPSGECLGFFQEFIRPGARKLERILVSVAPVNFKVEYILDPWHEPDSISRMTPEELAVIRRTEPQPWVLRWKHRINPPKGVDVEALLRQLT